MKQAVSLLRFFSSDKEEKRSRLPPLYCCSPWQCARDSVACIQGVCACGVRGSALGPCAPVGAQIPAERQRLRQTGATEAEAARLLCRFNPSPAGAAGCTFRQADLNQPRARLRCPPYGLTMRRIRANAIAILTVAWILGTFYYLWQDSKPASTPSSSASQARGRGHGQKLVPGRLEIHRDDRTIPLIVSERGSGRRKGGGVPVMKR